ncbi:helix-turn-helix domain-containing protein [Chryseobacterium sp. CT-SW4]|uniref:helix-turn-helix domain-containing protein n=1 Tax=Chryseobacterium sp. SW-1 TaxID=3157343 RepID=UPI003B02A48B
MKTIKFHKSECGVEVLLNVLSGENIKKNYLDTEMYSTDYFEIVFLKKAAGTLLLNQQKVDIRDNSIVFISPFQKRQWNLDQELDFTVLVFQEDFLNEFFADKLFTYRLLYFYQLEHPLRISVDDEGMRAWCKILTEIKEELVNVKPDSAHIIRSLLYYLLQSVNRKYAQENNLSLEGTASTYAFHFKMLLENNILQKQKVEEYAEMLGISRISLNKAVKSQYNITASDLIKRRLVFEIQNRLIYSGKTVSQIAHDLNFSEPNHLMRFFKTQTGKTTTEFIREYIK